jgi:GNAT superfamily N-acetyltransferase
VSALRVRRSRHLFLKIVNDEIRILPGRAENVSTILALIRALAEYERLSDHVVATEAGLTRWLFGDRPAAEVVIAWAGDEPVGFALFFHNFSTFLGRPGLYLEDLFVKPEWRGRGVGRRLLSHLAAIAMERGCGRFEWAVLDWNEPAIAFYRRMGAVVLEDWRVCRVTGEALATLASLA